MLNILFVHEVDWEKKVVFDVHWMSETLSLLGHNVYAISYESMWRRGDSKKDKVATVSRALSGSKVCVVRPPLIKRQAVCRISATLSHTLVISDVVRSCNIDVIVLRF